MTLAESFWLVVQIFFFFAYLMVLFQVLGDLFRDTTLGGFAKALWVLFFILVPLITVLIYLVVRGKGMTERQLAAIAQAEKGTREYIREAAGTGAAQEIAAAKALLDAGTLTQAEFDALKARALA